MRSAWVVVLVAVVALTAALLTRLSFRRASHDCAQHTVQSVAAAARTEGSPLVKPSGLTATITVLTEAGLAPALAALRAQPVLVLLTASRNPSGERWCPDCRRADPVLAQAVAGAPPEVQLLQVEIDRARWKGDPGSAHPYRAEPFKVSGIPTLLVLGPGHEVQARLGEEACRDLRALAPAFQWHPAQVERLPAGPCNDTLCSGGLARLNWLRAQYSAAGADSSWGQRGLPLMFERFGLVLAAEVVREPLGVRLRNVAPHVSCESVAVNLTTWWRVAGAEIVAGLMEPVPGECAWLARLPSLPAGQYDLDVKLLSLRDGFDWDADRCSQKPDIFRQGRVLEVVKSQKFYEPALSCCEICTRNPLCSSWAVYNRDKYQLVYNCVLYDNQRDGQVDTGELGMPGAMSGLPRRQPTNLFIGCGWSFALNAMHPCVANGTDDIPFVADTSFTIEAGQPTDSVKKLLPVCGNDVNDGRWVKDTASVCSYTDDSTTGRRKELYMLDWDPDQSIDCWMHDRLNKLGARCQEMGCRLAKQSIWRSRLTNRQSVFKYVWRPYRCQLPSYTGQMIKQCFEARDLAVPILLGTSVMEFLNEYVTQRMMPLQIRYGKKVVIFSDESLPQSATLHSEKGWLDKLNEIAFPGSASRATFEQQLLDTEMQLLSESTFSAFQAQPKQTTTLQKLFSLLNSTRVVRSGNWGWRPHVFVCQAASALLGAVPTATEFNSSQKTELERVAKLYLKLCNTVKASGASRYVFLSGPFLSSEREAHATAGRVRRLDELARPMLARKNIERLSWWNVSMALSFDSATQMDGLHVVGPPMKALFNLMIHSLCSQTETAGTPNRPPLSDAPSRSPTQAPKTTGRVDGYSTFVHQVITNLQSAPISTESALASGLGTVEVPDKDALWMEFGVYSGGSTERILGKLTELHKLLKPSNPAFFAFDSFEGLPESWNVGFDTSPYEKGSFKKGEPPFNHSAVTWVRGWFNESIPKLLSSRQFSKQHGHKNITFVHLDADLYSSTATILEQIGPRLHPGCILVFGELVNYPNYRDGELKALWEFVVRTGRRIEPISRHSDVLLDIPTSIREFDKLKLTFAMAVRIL